MTDSPTYLGNYVTADIGIKQLAQGDVAATPRSDVARPNGWNTATVMVACVPGPLASAVRVNERRGADTEQLTECERVGVDLSCCSEAILGGFAHDPRR